MQFKRKLQLGALAVIANAAMALFAISPGPALAGTCGAKYVCGWTANGTCPAHATGICNSATPPGCTLASATCVDVLCGSVGGVVFQDVYCVYQ